MQILPSHYFLPFQDQLYRAVQIQLPVPYSGPVEGWVEDGRERFRVRREFLEGRALIPASACFDQPVTLRVGLTCPAGEWRGQADLPPTRQWTVYITQDKHLDYGWIHPVEQVVERINNLTDFALDHAMRWTFESSIWIEEYRKARPSSRAEALLARLQDGAFETAANYLVPSPGLLSVEEVAELLRAARGLQDAGVPIQTTLLQEAPSLPWGFATLLAEARLPYLVKGAYDLRNPHLKEREPYPLFYWEGPDGSRVLTRWDLTDETYRWGGYGEAYPLWRKIERPAQLDYIEQTIARFQAYQHYPWRAILLVGTGFDEFPRTTAVTDFINWYNSQEWAFPRLVDATWKEFWQDLESQCDPRQVPVLRGDWGTAWEEWPAQLARLATLYRRARPVVLAGQALSVVAARLDPPSQPGRKRALADAWRGLLQFGEHDFGGISPDLAEDVTETKAGYAHLALREGTRALESAISSLAAQVGQAEGSAVVVANPNSWERGGMVEVVVQDPCGYEVTDLSSGESLPCQLETRGPGWLQHYLSFEARGIAGFGYRTYALRTSPAPTVLTEAIPSAAEYENQSYQLVLDPQTGGLSSLVDRKTGRELVQAGAYALFEFLHHAEGTLQRSRLDSISLRRGAVCDHLITETTNLRSRLRSTYRLYHASQRLEVSHDLYQEPSSVPQASWFALPFRVQDHQFYYDGAAAILRPGLQSRGGDLLSGAGLSSCAAQSFLAVTDPAGTIVLASPDSYLFQFGEQVLLQPMGDSDPGQALALALVMHNFTRNDHLVRQSGQEYFSFRYSLAASPGPFRASQAVQFAVEAAQGLARTWAGGGSAAPLPPAGSFLSVSPERLVATTLKTAENGRGWVLRLWECDGQPAEALVDPGGLGAGQAFACDLLEGNATPLPLVNGRVRLPIPAHGLKTLRFA